MSSRDLKKKHIEKCVECGRLMPLVSKKSGKCGACYNRGRLQSLVGTCSECGAKKPLASRGMCSVCYERNRRCACLPERVANPKRPHKKKAVCTECGQVTYIRGAGIVLCVACRDEHRRAKAEAKSYSAQRVQAHHYHCIRKYFGAAYLAEYLAAKGKIYETNIITGCN